MQAFRDNSSKEELVDEPIMNLGRQFQLSQNIIDFDKESWEMHEFLKPVAKEFGEEREMLVDEECDVTQYGYSYIPVGMKDFASSTETDVEDARQRETEVEPTKKPKLIPETGISPEEVHCCTVNKAERVNMLE